MTKAKRLMQLEPEWMDRDERQARKRINRVSQTELTHTYALIFERSRIEEIIQDRQARRAYILKLVLDSANLQIDVVTREVKDVKDDKDDKDDDSDIKITNEL